ncbi:MAG: NIL domain-containing protein [Desulfurivibrionaceae bacterium]|jgi:ferredoxin|nr:4Fe-4S binding protein [Pseudomonadota bacterium]MCG2822264.1 4Fe-4S binding protein [Desulfobulbaceae bacterium]MDP2003436.1 4Fe-4S binding protein [Desulfurivibrionaceae bacterium]MBU4228931.1 4Fe-4S binding protein [Pseudomonadota bacterium]MBU4411907.1 4Fe-4S binding protein [Pseudomonadota bacterium]
MNTRIYVLKFPKEVIDQPIISNLVKKYDLEFNILKATILLQQEGVMVLEFIGHKANVKKGIAYLNEMGVSVKSMAGNIHRDEEKCYQCGACTGVCPTGALSLHRPDMAVLFDEEKCTACGLCVSVCPARAMEVSLNGSVAELAA